MGGYMKKNSLFILVIFAVVLSAPAMEPPAQVLRRWPKMGPREQARYQMLHNLREGYRGTEYTDTNGTIEGCYNTPEGKACWYLTPNNDLYQKPKPTDKYMTRFVLDESCQHFTSAHGYWRVAINEYNRFEFHKIEEIN